MENKKLKYACDSAKSIIFYPFFIYFKNSGLWEDAEKNWEAHSQPKSNI